jgi:hypothetical protein
MIGFGGSGRVTSSEALSGVMYVFCGDTESCGLAAGLTVGTFKVFLVGGLVGFPVRRRVVGFLVGRLVGFPVRRRVVGFLVGRLVGFLVGDFVIFLEGLLVLLLVGRVEVNTLLITVVQKIPVLTAPFVGLR